MKKVFLTLISLCIIILFIGTAVFLYQKSQEKPVVYETDSPFYTDIILKTVATGKIVPRKEIEIKPQVSGVIDKLFVEAGEQVKKGDLIARIQLIPDMEHLNNAESALQRAMLNLDNLGQEYERQQKLFNDKLISVTAYNKIRLDYQLAEEIVRSAENNVALIKEGASKASGQVANLVKSTVEGMILDVPVKQGTFVTETNTFNQGTTIANVANMNDLIFEGNLDESEVGRVREGMDLVLSVGAIEGKTFNANLEYISPKGADDQGTIKFEIRASVIPNEDVFLRAGYSANADIVLDRRANVLAINEGNLIAEDSVTYVEIETGEQNFKQQTVKTGISDGINIEIIEGLTEDTKIKKRVK